ncbi:MULTISPECIES: ATP-binding cassette domain-containing protein [Sphingobacterium]|uniref:ATP-binding cassette domain-containing protein n=1 Tax=Sphingobacterium TaxID=28453 RepID=UPI0013D9396B|nr:MULTISPECIES: ATP-binding cassette domain-containing protein [unclassified Sphingobacterium]
MTEPFVYIQDLTIQYQDKKVLNDLTWVLNKGEHYLLGGESGSGKTTLAKAFAAANPAKALYISNWYQFTNLEGDRNFYYQQRYNRHQGHDTLTVLAELEHHAQKENLNLSDIQERIVDFGFKDTLQSQLIELSSGEHKKLQLIKGLWSKPELLIIDEPYTGLDAQSRITLNNWLDDLAKVGVQLMLISNDRQLPRAINRFVHIVEGKIEQVDTPELLSKNPEREVMNFPGFLASSPQHDYRYIAQLHNVSIRYGEKEILKNISWEVKTGEKWLLQGPNGSGKSTLLSLINGDHPQSYGLDIHLFGQRRGTGESIWDIKKKIGIISPEMHWYFDQNATVWHTLASGFYDSIGWFIDVKFQERQQIEELLEFFGLTAFKNLKLQHLPLGQQRLALLARTIIKNPPLLVLDEPCQGLDAAQTSYFNAVVDELAQHGTTLIYVGHYESQLPSCIDHKLVLERGEVKTTTYNIKQKSALEKESAIL